MTNLVFLEAATQSEGAETIIESNESLINFATAEVDALVEEQALHTAWHVGAFVENDFSTTYENVTDPIADIVTEATSIFADVIASDELTESEKMDCISSWAHIIAMDDVDSWEEGFLDKVKGAGAAVGSKAKSAGSYVGGKAKSAGSYVAGKAKMAGGKVADAGQIARGAVDSKLGGMSKKAAAGAGSVGGAVAGAGVGAGVGAAIGSVSKLFSKERKAWKALVKQEKAAHKKGANAAVLKKIHDAKMKARGEYMKMRNSAAKKGAKIGGAVGAVGGAVGGGMYGHKHGAAA